MRRADPRRVAVLAVLVVGAVGGCLIGVALGRLDDGPTARVAPTEAERLADSARRLAPVVGVAVAIIVVAAGGFTGSASIWLSGAFAGMLVAVGMRYRLPQFRRGSG